MKLVSVRHAILLGALATIALDLVLLGCSSDKPPSGGGVTSPDAAPLMADANQQADAGYDGASSDAADGEVAKGLCLDEQPAPNDGGTDGGADGSAAPVCPQAGPCSTICANVVDHYKLGVAQVAVACLLELPSCAVTTDVLACVDTALGMACPDPASTGYCTALVTACDPNAGGPGANIDQAGCESFAHGMSASGRRAFAGCLESKTDAGTCPADVVMCADDIRQ